MAAGQADLPQAGGQALLQPTLVNTQVPPPAASPAPSAPAAAAAVPTQVSLSSHTVCWICYYFNAKALRSFASI